MSRRTSRGSPLWLPLIVCALAALAPLGGCKRSSRHLVQGVDVADGTVRDNALLGMGPEQVTDLLRQKLEDSGHFRFPPEGDAPRRGQARTTMKLEVGFTREAHKDGREGTWAEVGASLQIVRKTGSEKRRYELAGLGEARVNAPEDRARAMRAALDQALGQLVQLADLQLAALGKPASELLDDLKSDDPRVQDFALRVLSERGNPAVTEALIDRLKKAEDLNQVRRVMGALAELREQKAVKTLIELTRGQDPSFVREVVFALAQIGGDEATAYLFTVAQGHDDPVLREAAQQALNEIKARERGH